MTDLSPAAQVILHEFWGARVSPLSSVQIAAALRAAANEVCLRWAELEHPADVLNAIAAELESQ